MNSEVQLDVLKDAEETKRKEAKAQANKESRIVREASDAVEFERLPHWQMMKKDLEEVRDRIVDRIMNDDNLTDTQRNLFRVKANDIRLFLDHPKLYVKKLNDFLTKKYPKRKRGILSWLKPQPQ